jgi:ubiquinone/menaquinone biosynthesis C-methylase UbiE
MLLKILPYMRCPQCAGANLKNDGTGIVCSACGSQYPVLRGIPDMLGSGQGEVITPFQRLMQTPAVVNIYEKFWRRLGYYIASSRSFSDEMQTVLRFGASRNSGLTLDLACGTGIFTRPLAAQRKDSLLIGLDMSRPMLNRAQKLREKERAANIVFIRATAFSLPFSDNSFSYINCCGALHLFDRPDIALREIGRILAPEGQLCVQTTLRPNRSAGMAYFLERFIRFGFFDENELKSLLRNHGFAIEKSERHRISYTFLAKKQKPEA